MKLEIFSDIVCPWCFIMKCQLDEALDELGAIQREVRWRPYQLYPGLPAEGLDRADYLRGRYGDEVDAARVPEGIQRAAAEAGLAFDYVAMKRVPNTFDAHRLMDFAYDAGCQHALAETLFEYHFCLGKDVADRDTLVCAAVSSGLDREGVERSFESDQGRIEVKEQLARARDLDIVGVPCILIEERFRIPGAQGSDALRQMIQRAALRLEGAR